MRLKFAFILCTIVAVQAQSQCIQVANLLDSLQGIEFTTLTHSNKIFSTDDTVFIYTKCRKYEKMILSNVFGKDYQIDKLLTDSSQFKLKDFENVITLKVNDNGFSNFKVLLLVAGMNTFLISVDRNGKYISGMKFMVELPGSYYLVDKKEQIYDCLFKGVRTSVEPNKNIRQIYWKGVQSGLSKKTQFSVEKENLFKFDLQGKLVSAH